MAGSVVKSKSKGGMGELLKFPVRDRSEMMKKQDMLEILDKAGCKLEPKVLTMMRLPKRMIQGIAEKCEFFDILSTQPFPIRPEDSPSYCHDAGLPAPKWINTRYLSYEEKDGKAFITFVDATRGIFLKSEYSERLNLAVDIYDKLIKP